METPTTKSRLSLGRSALQPTKPTAQMSASNEKDRGRFSPKTKARLGITTLMISDFTLRKSFNAFSPMIGQNQHSPPL
jgi:hypothetical protein